MKMYGKRSRLSGGGSGEYRIQVVTCCALRYRNSSVCVSTTLSKVLAIIAINIFTRMMTAQMRKRYIIGSARKLVEECERHVKWPSPPISVPSKSVFATNMMFSNSTSGSMHPAGRLLARPYGSAYSARKKLLKVSINQPSKKAQMRTSFIMRRAESITGPTAKLRCDRRGMALNQRRESEKARNSRAESGTMSVCRQ